MKYLALFIATLALSQMALAAEHPPQVCLKIDVGDTNPGANPNMVCEVDDFSKTFFVNQGETACFDLSKQYYLMIFMSESPRETIYGTECKYEPNAKDEGKTIIFKGENGDSICPTL